MKKLFKKQFRYENCLILLQIIILLITSIIKIVGNELSEISILHPLIFGYPLLVIAIICLGIEIASLIVKNNQTLQKVKRIMFLVITILTIIVLFDVIVLGIIRTFVIAHRFEGRPTTANSTLLVRLAYITINNYTSILQGVWTTIWLSLLGTIIGLVIALVFVTFRTLEVTERDNEFSAFLKKIAKGFVQIYVTVFRGTPMMVQAMIIYYFLPVILANLFSINQQIINQIISVSVAGLITVSLNTAAYLTEVLRGGIESIDKGQMEASRSLGMSRAQSFIHIIIPQGFKNSLPSICNEFIINIKDTSVLSVISVMDLYFIISTINGKTANQDAIFICAAIYLVLTYTISKVLSLLEKKLNLVAKPLPSSN